MNKEFVNYEQALALKELGFDEPCFGAFIGKEFKFFDFSNDLNGYVNDKNLIIGAPHYQQAFRWFREKYNLKSWVEEHTADTFIYEIRPHILTHYKKGEVYVYTIYKEAELACLIKLIEIVKNNEKRK